MFRESCLQVIVILNVNEFHLVLCSSLSWISLKWITQQFHDISVLSEILESVLEVINESAD